jgi:hypothetical protein
MKKYYANDIRVASKLVEYGGVSKVSDFIDGAGKNTKKLDVDTEFSAEALAYLVLNYPNKYKKYVVDYVQKNPRVKRVVYTTNMRLTKKVAGVK